MARFELGFIHAYTPERVSKNVQHESGYSRNVVLGCILYLHDVTESRKRREHQDYLKVFRELCGEHIWRAVTVVTTKWELVKENREEQATRRDTNLNSIFPEVARCRFEDSPQSAWDIVRASITVNNPTRGLQIQEELVELDKIVPDTNAAKELRSILPAILGNARRWRLGDETERKQRVKELVRQIDQLKVPLLYRFRQFIRGAGASENEPVKDDNANVTL
ncbi:hypothetical protein CPB84DRAFT_1750582 [Gymnopilus junonius]|uniref:Uncharacterized protein n=1 Tax=Gymnopilus junonius TaxID=109634 RepID=A0A9P5TI70_GYMJU|nr:hypothetical protein CPB84DRAFT_1750582 [Gymnopilus junonius]